MQALIMSVDFFDFIDTSRYDESSKIENYPFSE